MKVLVLSNRAPFVHGGAEELTAHLIRQLREAGHEAEDARIPFSWTPYPRLYDEMLIAKQIRIANVDRVVALKYPAYLIEHPCKVVWLLHQYRQAYDLFDAGQTDIPATPEGDKLRLAIRTADEQTFAGAHRLFAIAEARRRLKAYHDIDAEELSAPLNDPELFECREPEGYVFAGGRVNASKRQSLLIEALRYAPGIRLIVAGPPEEPDTENRLKKLALEHGVDDRLTLDLRFLKRVEIADLVNRCNAVAYIPFQEDSVGYVTLEAFQASKPVITAQDAGGVLSIVRDGETGYVGAPSPQALGALMRKAIADPTRATNMGRNARAELERLDLSWPNVLSKLLS